MRSRLALLLAALGACSPGEPPPLGKAVRSADLPDFPAPIAPVGDAVGGALVLARHGGRDVAFVADEDDRAVVEVDLVARAVVARTALPSRPGQLLVMQDGRLAVALRDGREVAIFEASQGTLREVRTLTTTAPEPIALAQADDGTLVVATGRGATLEGFAPENGQRRFVADVAPEPRAVRVVGGKAFVAHAAADEVSIADLAKKSVSRVALTHPATERCFAPLGPCAAFPERVARHGFAIAKGARGQLLVPATFVAPGPAEPTRGYGGDAADVPATAFGVEAIDAAVGARTELRLDPLERRALPDCRLPRAAAYDEKDRVLYVACMGNDAVLAQGADRVASYAAPAGTVGLALDPERRRVVAYGAFAREVAILPGPGKIGLPAPRPPRDAAVARGRALFHSGSGRVAKDGRACATCHIDGRDDGLAWSSPEGPRRTMPLAGRGIAGPFGWRGEHATFREHVVETVHRLEGRGLEPAEIDALAAYVATLPAPPSRDADPLVERGRAVFASGETGCVTCHDEARGFSDFAAHDVGSRGRFDRAASFRTPRLRGMAAPYFHDGRFATLRELLAETGGHGAVKMGSTRHLSTDDTAALLAFLNAL